MKKLILIATALFAVSEPLFAQEDWQSWPLADRFTISADAFFPQLNTRVQVNGTNGLIGTTLDFEQNLGMSDNEALPSLGFGWRFAKKHKLRVDYFELNRSGSAITTTEIRFGDETFQVALPISSFFDASVINLQYSYSIILDEKKELALLAGISLQDISFGLIGNNGAGPIRSETGVTAPLPAFGLTGGYAFTDKWIGRAGIGIFAMDLALSDEESVGGEVINAEIGIEHRTFENIHFGLRYAYFNVGVKFANESRLSSLDYQYRGPMLGVTGVF